MVEYGLAHRDVSDVESIGVDEIALQKGHKYATVVYQIDKPNKPSWFMNMVYLVYHIHKPNKPNKPNKPSQINDKPILILINQINHHGL